VPPDPNGTGPLLKINATSLVTSANNIQRGKRIIATLRVTNVSTVTYRGDLNITVDASPDNVIGGDDVQLATIVKRVNIKPGVTKRLKLKFRMPEARDDLLKFQLVATVLPDPVPGFGVSGGSVLDPRIINVLE
jgi:hypothetical protein